MVKDTIWKEVPKTLLSSAPVDETDDEVTVERNDIREIEPPIMFPGEIELYFKVPDL